MSPTPEECARDKRTAHKAQQIEKARNIAFAWMEEANDMRAAIEEALFQATLIEAPYINQVTEPLQKVLDAIDKKNKENESSGLPEIIRFSIDEIKGETGTFNPYAPTVAQKDSPK